MKHAAVPNLPTQLFLGGDWRDSSDGATFGVYNPARAELLANVASELTISRQGRREVRL